MRHRIRRPREFWRTLADGGLPWRIPYFLPVPDQFWSWLKDRSDDDQIRAFRRDYGVRGVGPRPKGKPPWDQPWGDPPTDEETEKELWGAFKRYLPDIDAPGRRVTEYGCMTVPSSTHHLRRHYFPMANMTSSAGLDDYPWPDVTEDWRWDGVAERARDLLNQGYWLTAGTGSIFETAWLCRGQEQFLIDLYDNPDFARVLLDRITDDRVYISRRLAEMGVDVLGGGDDMGVQTGLVMSPPMLDEWILSRWERVILAARSVKPDIKISFHTDGKMGEAIPRLIEIGVSDINPVQPELDDPRQLKQQYGRRLVLTGTVGAGTLAFGPPSKIRDEIAARMDTARNYGGMVITPNNSPDVNTPFENFHAFLEACETFGKICEEPD